MNIKEAILILVLMVNICSCNSSVDKERSDIAYNKISKVYDVINSNIDYLLTSKGALKTLIILAPILAVYCKYFDKTAIENMINLIIQKIGTIQKTYNIQKEIGENKAFWYFIYNNPLDMSLIYLKVLFDKSVYVGLPIVIGTLLNFFV